MRTAPSHADRSEPPEGGMFCAIHETIAAVAVEVPRTIAIVGQGVHLTYAELQAAASARASALWASGVKTGDRVALVSELCLDGVVDALAVLAVGAAYVPIDPSVGAARIDAILSDADVSVVLASPDATVLITGLDTPGIADPPEHEFVTSVRTLTGPHDVAYVIYTSGSTGQPKGVVVEHGNLAAMTAARREIYPGAPTFLVVSPLAFDSSAAGIWGTLTAGGTLVLAGPNEVRDPDCLVDLIASHSITHVLCIPALYDLVLRAARRRDEEPLGSLQVVVVAGESLPRAVVNAHFASHRHPVELVNEYGPTETTVWASYYRFASPGPVAIGDAVPGVVLHVLNDAGSPVTAGEPGELHIGGAGVARGYLGRPDETAAVFLPDPFVGGGSRMFRTGDRVRRRPDGALEFLGRLDHQVKVRGHRIELGSVEVAVRTAAPEVDLVVVVLDHAGTLRGYVEATEHLDETAVLERVRASVGEVATPVSLTRVDSLPRTFSGKVDRATLAERPAPMVVGAARPNIANNIGILAAVKRAWCKVLDLDEVPTDVGFLDVGGHSLAVFALQDALEAETGRRPRIIDLYRHATVADQATHLAPEDQTEPALSAPAAEHPTAGVGIVRRHRSKREPQ